MRVQIKATNLDLTPSIKEYLEKKLNSLEKYLQSEDQESLLASVELAKTTEHHRAGEVFKAEIQIRSSGKSYYAVAEKEDILAAIDEVRDEVAREITSSKDREQTLFRRGGAKIKALIKRLGFRN